MIIAIGSANIHQLMWIPYKEKKEKEKNKQDLLLMMRTLRGSVTLHY